MPLHNIIHVEELVHMGIKAAKERRHTDAYVLLVAALRRDPEHARAWLWLTDVVATREERRYCLQMTMECGPDLIAGLSFPHDPGPARRPVLFSEPEPPIGQLLALITAQPVSPTVSSPQQPVTVCDVDVLAEVTAMAQALAHNPLRLGQWLGYGARLVEEQRS